MCVLGCCVASTVLFMLSVPKPLGFSLTTSVDSCVETKIAPSVACPFLAEFGGRCQKAKLG